VTASRAIRGRNAAPDEVAEAQRWIPENKTVDIDQIRGWVDAENAVTAAARFYRERILPTLGNP
jgi:hypothetical protein